MCNYESDVNRNYKLLEEEIYDDGGIDKSDSDEVDNCDKLFHHSCRKIDDISFNTSDLHQKA